MSGEFPKAEIPEAVNVRGGRTSAERRRRERQSRYYVYKWGEVLDSIKRDAELEGLTANHLLDLWQSQFYKPWTETLPQPRDPDDFHKWLQDQADQEGP